MYFIKNHMLKIQDAIMEDFVDENQDYFLARTLFLRKSLITRRLRLSRKIKRYKNHINSFKGLMNSIMAARWYDIYNKQIENIVYEKTLLDSTYWIITAEHPTEGLTDKKKFVFPARTLGMLLYHLGYTDMQWYNHNCHILPDKELLIFIDKRKSELAIDAGIMASNCMINVDALK